MADIDAKIQAKKRRNRLLFNSAAITYGSLIYLFLYLPILIVILFSFNTSRMNLTFQGFTFDWWGSMFSNRTLLESFYNSIIVAGASTILSVIIGTLGAVGMYKFEFKLKSVLSNSLYIPIAIPEIVFGISLLMFFSSLHVQTGMVTMIIAHVTFSMPFVLITVRARIAGHDRALEEAAKDLGAGESHTFFRVTLPCIMPGIISGGMLALTLSLDDVIISAFTNGPDAKTLPIKILELSRRGVPPDAYALSTLMIIGTVVIMLSSQLVQNRMLKKRGEETVSP